jgi:pimeloyl-ACP methyl ester carboxylesterase
MKTKDLLLALFLFVLIVVSGCKKNSDINNIPDATGGRNAFISASSLGNYTALQLQALAATKGFGIYAALAKFDVDFYRITYETTYNGKPIEASGTLAIPKNTPFTPALLSAQHGTIFSDADVPSAFPTAFTGFELFASTGFVTVIPDFIGYGASKSTFPPYYDMGYSGSAVVDMLKASKYYLSTIRKTISNKLFLVGYSEGGYVTMAAQRQIEMSGDNNLILTAAAEGAGGYDLTGEMSAIATMPTYPDPSFLALIVQAYDITYAWNRPLTDFFASSYAYQIPTLLNGTLNSDQINAHLNTNLNSLFNPTFYANLLNPPAETVLKNQLASNSFPNWFPKSQTRMYHGTADEDVFFQTSQTTYTRFKAAGAPNLTFTPIPGGTHETSVIPMMLDVLPWFTALSQ